MTVPTPSTVGQLQILDCTFRDGGYYNNWYFPPPVVAAYLQALGSAGVDVLEMGFRFFPEQEFLGPFAYTADDLLRSLPLPRGVAIAVMSDAKDILSHPGGVRTAVGALYRPADDSPVDMVRIATSFANVTRCEAVTEALRALGYRVGLNLMQATGKSVEEIAHAAKTVDGWGTVEVLYVADSLGNMDPDKVGQTLDALRAGWHGPIGMHTHDNKGQALVNSLAALDAGASWIDGTVLGMGRGAGNTRTEHLLLEVRRRGQTKYEPEALFPLVIDHFEPMRARYGWGQNLLYYLSATYGIHPTYVQEMLGTGQYETHSVIAALEFLRDQGASAYNTEGLQQALLGRVVGSDGTWSAKGFAAGRTVLIVGPGPGADEHADALARFIDKTAPVVIALNTASAVSPEKVTAYAACHKTRLLLDAPKYTSLGRPLIMPLASIPDVVRPQLSGVDVWDYGMTVQEGVFQGQECSCTLPSTLAAGYAMAAAVAGGADRILLAGFDGYESTDVRQHEVNHLFDVYAKSPGAIPVLAITPTTYNVTRASVYSPEF